jgi:hypothetical protein
MEWIDQYADVDEHIPLFDTGDRGEVEIKRHGRDNRPILKRNPAMEALLQNEGQKIIDDWKTSDNTYEGLIYLMYTVDGGENVPLYIGKAGKYGRDGERLSANLRNIQTNRSKFARWGDGYAYHIGELSAAVLNHHNDQQVNREKDPIEKYLNWASALFESDSRTLRQPVYFWTRAWRVDDTGPFYDFETSLEALEYNLINLASDLYPGRLLNAEGA